MLSLSAQARLLAMVFLFIGVLGSGDLAAQQETSAEALDRIVRELTPTAGPGCAVGAFRDGQIVYSKHHGQAHMEHDVPLHEGSRIYVGSVSKQFVAAAVALAAQEGYLSLDDDIRTYIPELPEYPRTITPRHLVHHTSGIMDLYTLQDVAGHYIEDVFPDEDALRLIAGHTDLEFVPGDEYLYSNGAYFLQAILIERATGLSLREFTDSYVFTPLGMNDTHFHDDRTEVVPHRAMSYRLVDGQWRNAYFHNFERVGPGGLKTTLDDLLKWDQNFYEMTLGGPNFVEQLHEVGVLNDGSRTDYAFGLRIAEHNGLRTVGHGGSFHGFRAHLVRYPDHHFSVAVQCNYDHAQPSVIARRIAEAFLGQEMNPALEPFVGTYHTDLGATYSIELIHGALYLTREGRDHRAIRLSAQGARTFVATESWWRTDSARLNFDPPQGTETAASGVGRLSPGFELMIGGRGTVAFERVD